VVIVFALEFNGDQYVTFHCVVPTGWEAFMEIPEVTVSDPPPATAMLPAGHVAVTLTAVADVGPGPVALTIVNVLGDP
jgi:hypothetical protein